MVVDPLIKFMKISEVARSANEAAPGAKRRRFFPHSINLLYSIQALHLFSHLSSLFRSVQEINSQYLQLERIYLAQHRNLDSGSSSPFSSKLTL
jgi:hypothetical protein